MTGDFAKNRLQVDQPTRFPAQPLTCLDVVLANTGLELLVIENSCIRQGEQLVGACSSTSLTTFVSEFNHPLQFFDFVEEWLCR